MIVVLDVTGNRGEIVWRDGSTQEACVLEGRKHAETLAPALASLIDGRHLEALGVVTGPGSFTGIRIGIATFLGFRAALNIPVYGISTFDLIWHQAGCPKLPCHVILEQSRGFVVQSYTSTGVRQSMINSLEGFAGQALYSDQALGPEVNQVGGLRLPTFLDLIADAAISPSAELEPCYVRPPDAIRGRNLLDELLAKSR